jgi:hypothetical protein
LTEKILPLKRCERFFGRQRKARRAEFNDGAPVFERFLGKSANLFFRERSKD